MSKADEIRELDLRLKVYEAVVQGKSVGLIAEELNLARGTVRDMMRDVANTMMDGYHEQLEWVRARSHARLEELYRIASARATGRLLETDKKNSVLKGVPDRHWMRLTVDIIKAQVDLMQTDEAWVKQRAEEGKKNLDSRTVETITITRTSEMYERAHEAEWQRWADTNLEQYLSNQDEPITVEARDIKEMQDELNSLEENLGEYIDELDEDE